jgi:hypothetical protein
MNTNILEQIRLTQTQLDVIIKNFHRHFLKGDKLWLFGSRTNTSQKGGDIDLYIETAALSIESAVKMQASFVWDIQAGIGEQKIDVVLNVLSVPYPLPIHDVAKTTGVQLV